MEHNISTEVAIQHEHAAQRSLRALGGLTGRHLPELGAEDAARLVETTLLVAMTAWPCSQPSPATLAAYASEPELAAMRLDFTDLVRRATAATASGLFTRQQHPTGA